MITKRESSDFRSKVQTRFKGVKTRNVWMLLVWKLIIITIIKIIIIIKNSFLAIFFFDGSGFYRVNVSTNRAVRSSLVRACSSRAYRKHYFRNIHTLPFLHIPVCLNIKEDLCLMMSFKQICASFFIHVLAFFFVNFKGKVPIKIKWGPDLTCLLWHDSVVTDRFEVN